MPGLGATDLVQQLDGPSVEVVDRVGIPIEGVDGEDLLARLRRRHPAVIVGGPRRSLGRSDEHGRKTTRLRSLLLGAALFCIGVYGVLARKNGMLVLMSVELILNAVNINLVAFGALTDDVGGEVFALFTIAVAAAEVGVGLAIVLLMYRNRRSIDLSEADLMKG